MTALTALSVTALVSLIVSGCGGSSSPTAPSSDGSSSSGTGTGSTGVTITITAAGASPLAVTVAPGTQITFTNNDNVTHLMYSDPHPDHTDCPEINQVGNLAPGQSRQTGNLNTVRTCGFHDHDRPTVASLHGSITIR